VYGHRLTQLPKLLNRDKTLSNVVLLQHREIRDLRQFGSSARQVHHLSQQAQISIYGCVRRSFSLPLLDELVEQVGRDGRDQATLQERIQMFSRRMQTPMTHLTGPLRPDLQRLGS
jgi:hypothetical protein